MMLLLVLISLLTAPAAVAGLKVFVLAGQSNMVGMASMDHLDLLTTQPGEYRKTLWNAKESSYKHRDDVYIKYDDAHGKLTVNRTCGFAAPNHFGPEVMFGWAVGDAETSAAPGERVFLIKTAWGGKTLSVDFRPPAAGEGNYSGIKPIEYGYYYRAMILDVLDTLDNLAKYVPGYQEEEGYDLAGFLWFQGWNDMLNMPMVQEYGSNLKYFLRDVRSDLGAPDLPIVVGELGMHGVNFTGRGSDRVMKMRAAQHAVCLLPEFKDTTRFVRTAPYAVGENATTYNGIYHYWGRADTYYHIGKAFGEAMVQLLAQSRKRVPRFFSGYQHD